MQRFETHCVPAPHQCAETQDCVSATALAEDPVGFSRLFYSPTLPLSLCLSTRPKSARVKVSLEKRKASRENWGVTQPLKAIHIVKHSSDCSAHQQCGTSWVMLARVLEGQSGGQVATCLEPRVHPRPVSSERHRTRA